MKKALSFFLVLVFFLSALVSVRADVFTVSYMTYDTTYEAILDMYIRVLNANGDDGHRHDLFNNLIWNDFHHDAETPVSQRTREAKSRVGYCIHDLNGDGIDELIIGENYLYVNEVFTMDNGKVRELIRAGMKYSCALLTGGRFYRSVNGGASCSASEVWSMDGTGGVQFVEGILEDDEFGAYYDADGNYRIPEYPWFRMTDPDNWQASEETRVTMDEYVDWLKKQDQDLLQLSFVPLALYEQGIGADQVGIVSVNGETDGKETVNVRKKAKKNSGLVKTVRTGTYVNILGEEENYYHVSFSGLEGYIQKDFLTVTDGTTAAEAGSVDSDKEAESVQKQADLSSPASTSTPEPGDVEQTAPESVTDSIYIDVIDHYEDVEVQYSREVFDHDEYTMEDNGNGEFVEVVHPVYRTEYYTVTEQRPVYRRDLKENVSPGDND